MKLNTKFFLITILILSILSFSPNAFAIEETSTVKVAMSEDESIIVERILYTALKLNGYQMVTKTAGMRTMVNDANYGDAAIVPAQTIGLDEEYTNLIRVPVPISYVETNAYTRSDDSYDFSDWSDLTGLRLSHCWKNLYITKNVPRAGASEIVVLNEYDDLWQSLLTNETDVAVIPNLTGFVRIVPDGVELAGVIEREPRYTYVNKDYAYLVPLLTKAYEEMNNDGTMDKIRNSEQSGEKQIVLHISSYNSQTEWENSEINAIRKSLELNLDIEYINLNLNARQTNNSININRIIENTIRTNFIERNPDLIIASDNDALEFVLNNYYMLFPKVPVVFCGINDFDTSMLHGFEEYVTGVTESESFNETCEEMLRLYPETKRIYILNDYTNSGLKWRDTLQQKIDACDFSIEFEFNENDSLTEILEDIRSFDSDTLVLLGTYFLDSKNTFYLEKEIQELVSSASENPVFCLADSYNGHGTFGGRVSVGVAQGRIAGEMANDILNGKNPSEIPIIMDSDSLNQWQFDYTVAKEYGINTSSLPEGHEAINRKLYIWETNTLEFKLILTAVGFFIVIIIILTLFLRLMRKKNKNLLEIQSHLHSAEELNEVMSTAAEREREANLLKSLFLSNMSHEIRTPVNAITGMTIIGKSSTDAKKKDYAFDRIENASTHLLGVINDILDMSKIEADKFELSNTDFDFEKMIQKLVDIINFRVEEKMQHFTVFIDNDIPKMLNGDDQRLSQVITNLLSNAVKFTPENGSIRLEAKLLNKENDIYTLRIEVTDTGIGIDSKMQSRLFEAFEQADINTTRQFGGSGLGLAISKRIVESMGGSIWIESELNKGSKFIFTVQTKLGTSEISSDTTTVQPIDVCFKGYSILLAEDIEINREIIIALLESTQLEIDCAKNGVEAVKMFSDTPSRYDLILMDVQMPEMDGLEATRRIRSLGFEKATEIPIIAMTANVFREDVEKCLEVGMNAHLGKPLNIEEVYKKLQNYLK